MNRFYLCALLLFVASLVGGTWFAVRVLVRSRESRAADAAVAQKIHDQLVVALRGEQEFESRFGKFLRLDGAGYVRPQYMWQLIERIEMDRIAVFDRGQVLLHVMAHCGSDPRLDHQPLTVLNWSACAPRVGQSANIVEYDVSVGIGLAAEMPRALNAAVVSPDGSLIALGYYHRIEVWNRADLRRVAEIRGLFGTVKSLECSADGTRIVAVCDGQTVQIWDVAPVRHVQTISTVSREVVQGADLTADGEHVVAAAEFSNGKTHQKAVVQTLSSTGVVPLMLPTYGWTKSVALSDDGKTAAAWCRDQPEIRTWNAVDGKPGPVLTTTAPAGSLEIDRCFFSPDGGRLFAFSSKMYTYRRPLVWKFPTGTPDNSLELAPQRMRFDYGGGPTAISADGRRLAMGNFFEGQATVWDVAAGKLLGLIEDELWQPAGSLANPANVTWDKARGEIRFRDRAGSASSGSRPNGRAKGLIAVGFDRSGNLVGVSLTDGIVWIWTADLSGPLPDPHVQPQRDRDGRLIPPFKLEGADLFPDAAPDDPRIPQPIAPRPDDILENGAGDLSKAYKWRFEWTPVKSATQYQFVLHRRGSPKPYVLMKTRNTTFVENLNGTYPEEGIYWRVRAEIDGKFGPWSPEHSLKVAPVVRKK